MDILYCGKDKVRLEGFSSIESRATFCFYDQSVVIIPEDPQNRGKVHFTVEFDKNRECDNIFLLKKLRDRGIPARSEFILIHGSYYELEQHPAP